VQCAKIWAAAVAVAWIAVPAAAWSEETIHHDELFDEGKLLATGGVTEVEGAGGGGLTPWALITGYETSDGIGVNVHVNPVILPKFTLISEGAAVGLYDRLELSVDHQQFDTGSTGARLGIGDGFTFGQTILGAKVKLFGDAVFSQDRWWMPQVSVGTQYKLNDQDAIIHAIGARSDHGTDYYVSATKVFLAESLLLNATVRETKANQFGILGFGGDRDNNYSTEFEGSAAFLVRRDLAVGMEFREKPNNLSFSEEHNAGDLFVAYFFSKHLSVTAAYVDLGEIALQKDQRGPYISLQAGF
jgi:hypothetical protein